MSLHEPHDLPALIALLFGLWSAFNPKFSTANTLNARRDKVLEGKLEKTHRFLILKNDWLPMCRVESVSNIGIVIALTLLAILFQPIPTAVPGNEGSSNEGPTVGAQKSESKQRDAGYNKVQQMDRSLYWTCWTLAIAGTLFKFLSAMRVDLIDYSAMRDNLAIPKQTSLIERLRLIVPWSLPEPSAKAPDPGANPANV